MGAVKYVLSLATMAPSQCSPRHMIGLRRQISPAQRIDTRIGLPIEEPATKTCYQNLACNPFEQSSAKAGNVTRYQL